MAPAPHRETSIEPMTSVPCPSRYTPVEYSRSKIMNTSSQLASRPKRISGIVTWRRTWAFDAPTVRADSSSSGPICKSAPDIRRSPYASQTTVYASQTEKIVLRSSFKPGTNRKIQQESEAREQPRDRPRDQHEIVEHLGDAAALAMSREPYSGVTRNGESATDRADQEGVDDRADLVRLTEDLREVFQRQHIGKLDALTPLFDKSAEHDPRNWHDDGEDEPQ